VQYSITIVQDCEECHSQVQGNVLWIALQRRTVGCD